MNNQLGRFSRTGVGVTGHPVIFQMTSATGNVGILVLLKQIPDKLERMPNSSPFLIHETQDGSMASM
jgi:hypothetical protein